MNKVWDLGVISPWWSLKYSGHITSIIICITHYFSGFRYVFFRVRRQSEISALVVHQGTKGLVGTVGLYARARVGAAPGRGASVGAAPGRGASDGGATGRWARVDGATFRGTRVDGATFRGARVGDAPRGGATFRGARVGDAPRRGARVGGAPGRGTRVDGATLLFDFRSRVDGHTTEHRRATIFDGAALVGDPATRVRGQRHNRRNRTAFRTPPATGHYGHGSLPR